MDAHIYTTSKAAQSGANNDLRDAYTALVDNTKWSQSVVFISAYYGVSFADQLFRFCKTAKMTRRRKIRACKKADRDKNSYEYHIPALQSFRIYRAKWPQALFARVRELFRRRFFYER
jgi:hypothetical protein